MTMTLAGAAAAALMLVALLALRAVRRQAVRSAQGAALLAQEMRVINLALDQTRLRTTRLQELTASLLRALTPIQVAEAACREGAAAAGAVGAFVLQSADGRLDLDVLAAGGGDGKEARESLAGPVGAAAAEVLRDGWARTLAEGESVWVLHALRFRDRPLGVLGLRYGGEGPPAESVAFVESVVQQCAHALERSRLYEAERAARVRAEFAERRLTFMASASARLGASLDLEWTLGDVADLVASDLADFCLIQVRDDEKVEAAAASMVREGRVVRPADVASVYPVSAASLRGWPGVLRTGRSELIPVMGDAVLSALAPEPADRETLRRLGLSSQIAVPIRARDAVIGAITIAATEAARPLTQADLRLAEELAVRVGQAIDRSRLYREALEASRAKSDFLAVMSHELRTPLNAIIGFSDLMLAGIPAPLPADSRRHAERVRGAANQLLGLVEDVLAFARAEASPEEVRVAAIPLDDVVAEAAALAAPSASAKRLEVACRARTGVVMHTDAGKVRQILNNLVSNAVKFTESGRVEIEAEAGPDEATVRVRDTGIGIEPEYLSKIFDPFWQVEPTNVRRFGGAGIGLGVARRLARQLGGDIRVASERGRGSTFELRLPLRIGQAASGQ